MKNNSQFDLLSIMKRIQVVETRKDVILLNKPRNIMNKTKLQDLLNSNETVYEYNKQWGDNQGPTIIEERSDAIMTLLDEESDVSIGGEIFSFHNSSRDADGDHDGYTWIATHKASNTFYMWTGWYGSHSGTERDGDTDIEQVVLRERVETYWSSDLKNPVVKLSNQA
jgi:hypothetical protein